MDLCVRLDARLFSQGGSPTQCEARQWPIYADSDAPATHPAWPDCADR